MKTQHLITDEASPADLRHARSLLRIAASHRSQGSFLLAADGFEKAANLFQLAGDPKEAERARKLASEARGTETAPAKDAGADLIGQPGYAWRLAHPRSKARA